MAVILKPFYDATLATEGYTATIDLTLQSIDFLLHIFEKAKTNYAKDTFLGPCANAGWKKLDEYYKLTERTPAYIAALVLCPQWKWTYFKAEWKKTWFKHAQKQVEDLWHSEYHEIVASAAIQEEEAQNEPLENSFLQWRTQKQGVEAIQDEYTSYIQAPVVKLPVARNGSQDARAWWLEPTQRATYPNLSIMALDLLSIPSMSASVERLFSGAKITITERRNLLGIEAVQATECLKSWLKPGSIAFIDLDLSDISNILVAEAEIVAS
jgi:hypothetical protein